MKKDLPAAYSPKGFTLIELLVAMAIVAILSTIGLVVYGNFQQRARDAKRANELGAIGSALEGKRQAGRIAYSPLASSDFASGSIPTDPLANNADTARKQNYCIFVYTAAQPVPPPTEQDMQSLDTRGGIDWTSCKTTPAASVTPATTTTPVTTVTPVTTTGGPTFTILNGSSYTAFEVPAVPIAYYASSQVVSSTAASAPVPAMNTVANPAANPAVPFGSVVSWAVCARKEADHKISCVYSKI